MQEEFLSSVTIVITTAVIYLARYVALLLKKKAEEAGIVAKIEQTELLKEFATTLILKAQKEYTSEDGQFKQNIVLSHLKRLASGTITKLNISDDQLLLIIETAYEAARDENLGGRFAEPRKKK